MVHAVKGDLIFDSKIGKIIGMKKFFLIVICMTCVGCSMVDRAVMRRQPPAQQAAYLSGKTPEQIQRLMGKPTVAREEKPYQMWAYRTGDCSTLIYFDAAEKSCFVDMRGGCARSVADAGGR